MSTGKLSLPESLHRSNRQDRAINVASTSFVHRHRSFIIVTHLVTVKSGDRQVITTGDRRHRQVRRPASYHYRRPASSPSSPETGKLSLPETGIVHRQVKSYVWLITTRHSQVRSGGSPGPSQVKSGPERIRDRKSSQVRSGEDP